LWWSTVIVLGGGGGGVIIDENIHVAVDVGWLKIVDVRVIMPVDKCQYMDVNNNVGADMVVNVYANTHVDMVMGMDVNAEVSVGGAGVVGWRWGNLN